MHGSIAVDGSIETIRPCLIEADAIGFFQDVNPVWRLADLEGRPIRKIRRSYFCKRCAERSKRFEHGRSILWAGLDEQIKVFRGARLGLDAESMSADDEILNCVCVECAQNIFQIAGQYGLALL